jgi:hypothetical protein
MKDLRGVIVDELVGASLVDQEEAEQIAGKIVDRTENPLLVEVGDILYGFCGGAFGRDSYSEKRVVFANHDCILVVEEGGRYNSDEDAYSLAQNEREETDDIRETLAQYKTPEVDEQ